jgi:hypothetical protein
MQTKGMVNILVPNQNYLNLCCILWVWISMHDRLVGRVSEKFKPRSIGDNNSSLAQLQV